MKTRRPKRIAALIILYFSLFIALMLVIISALSYTYSYNTILERTIDDAEIVLSQAGKNIGRYIVNINTMSQIINNNRELIRYLKNPKGEDAGLTFSYLRIFLNYIPQIDKNIFSIFIFGADGDAVYTPAPLKLKSDFDITEELWYKNLMEAPPYEAVITGAAVRGITEDNDAYVISLAKRILDSSNGKLLGIQLIELDYAVIENTLNDINLGKDGYLFIMNDSGEMLYHPLLINNTSAINEDAALILNSENAVIEISEENKLYITERIPDTNLKIVGVAFIDEIAAQAGEVIWGYCVLTGVLALIGVLISIRLAKLITKPIKKLELAVNEVEEGNLDADFSITGTYETEKFASSLSAMTANVKRLMARIVEDQRLIRTNELTALQSQINPHFLYNTLDSIVWMAEENGSPEIREIAVALAEYFRIVLSEGRDMITVSEELRHVRSYLIIQQMRYQNMSYEIEARDKTEDCIIPKLILQPIVENAIYHGIKNSADGKIIIRAYQSGKDLILKVEDNGRGMRPTVLNEVFAPRRKNAVGAGGVALNNIKERIKLYYGEDYGIEIKSAFRKGTQVILRLPVKRAD